MSLLISWLAISVNWSRIAVPLTTGRLPVVINRYSVMLKEKEYFHAFLAGVGTLNALDRLKRRRFSLFQ